MIAFNITVTTLLSCLPWYAIRTQYGETRAGHTNENIHHAMWYEHVGVARKVSTHFRFVLWLQQLRFNHTHLNVVNRLGPTLLHWRWWTQDRWQAVSEKPRHHNENTEIVNHTVNKGQVLFTLVYNIIYSLYSCLQSLFTHVSSIVVWYNIQLKQGY